jgi:hypothetical protein
MVKRDRFSRDANKYGSLTIFAFPSKASLLPCCKLLNNKGASSPWNVLTFRFAKIVKEP